MTFDEIYSLVSRLVQQNSASFASIEDIRADLNITGSSSGVIGAAVKSGQPSVQRGTIGVPEATVSVSADDLSALLTGRLNPMAAVFTGRLKVSGNYAKLMDLVKGFKG